MKTSKRFAHRACLTCLVTLSILASSGPAFAQDEGVFDGLGLGLGGLLSSTTLNLTTYGFSTYGIVALVQNLSKPKRAKAAHLYLKHNRHQLAQDIALGAGAHADDLAKIFGLPDELLPAFAQVLRSKRIELHDILCAESLELEDSLEFVRVVLDEMATTPAFAAHGLATL
ncbi:MAG: DUF3015 family protein [Myxococcota bacterium]